MYFTDFVLPNLPYLEEPQQCKLSKENNWTNVTFEQKYGLVIKGDSALEGIDFKVGICTHGPFAIPDKYRVVTCFLCITASKVLTKPVIIEMQHCVLMPYYKQSKSLLLLHADHRVVSYSDEYIFEPCHGSNCETYPILSSEVPTLTFEIQELCILCAAIDLQCQEQSAARCSDVVFQVSEPTHLSCSNNTFPRTQSVSSSASAASESYAKQPSWDSQNDDNDLTFSRKGSLKRQRSKESESSKRVCKDCEVEYALLLTEPCNKCPPFSVYIFVFENCNTSLEVR